MSIEMDPADVESREILAAATLAVARVLEIGAGPGRLTFRYADRVRSVIGVDASFTDIATAQKNRPANLLATFLCTSATSLPFRDGTFDVVLFANSF